MIQVRGLTYSYSAVESGQEPILKDINLDIKDGEFVAIIGANGSGKSTLAKHFNALLKPSSGRVIVDNLDTIDLNNRLLIKQIVGYLFQNPENQLIAPTVGEDVAFGPENLGLAPEEIRYRVEKALAQVGMQESIDRPIEMLSGGEKQCVALAGLLALNAHCLVLDEPTSMLDQVGKQRVGEIIRNLNKEGYTIVYITHHLEEIVDAHKVIIIAEGKLAFTGTVTEAINAIICNNYPMEIPPLLKLLAGLRRGGIKVPENILTVDQLVRYL